MFNIMEPSTSLLVDNLDAGYKAAVDAAATVQASLGK
jgi:hypothetical protein